MLFRALYLLFQFCLIWNTDGTGRSSNTFAKKRQRANATFKKYMFLNFWWQVRTHDTSSRLHKSIQRHTLQYPETSTNANQYSSSISSFSIPSSHIQETFFAGTISGCFQLRLQSLFSQVSRHQQSAPKQIFKRRKIDYHE